MGGGGGGGVMGRKINGMGWEGRKEERMEWVGRKDGRERGGGRRCSVTEREKRLGNTSLSRASVANEKPQQQVLIPADLFPFLTACSDLADVQSWSPSLMHIFLTCTSATSPAQPPDLLSISGVWERSGCGLGNLTSAGGFKGVGGSGGESGVGGTSGVGETSGVRKVITVQVGRPCKLSCDPGVLLEGCLGAVTALLDGKGEASGKDVRASGEAILTNSPACGGEGAKEGGDAKSGLLESSQISDGSYTEVQFSTVQVTLELSVPTECSTSKLSTPVLTHAPVTHSGAHSDGQAPGELQRPLVLSWEGLDCSFNGREGRAVCSRIQLSSLGEAGRQYIALPTTVECVLTQHLPTSSLDM